MTNIFRDFPKMLHFGKMHICSTNEHSGNERLFHRCLGKHERHRSVFDREEKRRKSRPPFQIGTNAARCTVALLASQPAHPGQQPFLFLRGGMIQPSQNLSSIVSVAAPVQLTYAARAGLVANVWLQ